MRCATAGNDELSSNYEPISEEEVGPLAFDDRNEDNNNDQEEKSNDDQEEESNNASQSLHLSIGWITIAIIVICLLVVVITAVRYIIQIISNTRNKPLGVTVTLAKEKKDNENEQPPPADVSNSQEDTVDEPPRDIPKS